MKNDDKNFIIIFISCIISLIIQKFIILSFNHLFLFPDQFPYEFILNKMFGLIWLIIFILLIFLLNKVIKSNIINSLKIYNYNNEYFINYIYIIFYSVIFSIIIIMLYFLVNNLSYKLLNINIYDSSKTLNFNNLIFNSKSKYNIGKFDIIYKEFFLVKNGFLFLSIELIYIFIVVIIEEIIFRLILFSNSNNSIFSNTICYLAFWGYTSSKEFLILIYFLYTYFLISKLYFYTHNLKYTILTHYIFEILFYVFSYLMLNSKFIKIFNLKNSLLLSIIIVSISIILFINYNKFLKKILRINKRN